MIHKTISKNDDSISFSLSSKFTNLTSSINHKNQPLSLQKRSRHAESPLFITDDQEDYFCSEGYYPSRKY